MTQIKNRLIGGQAGERKTEASHPFTHPGVKAVEVNRKKPCSGRFLPAFDETLRGTPGFATSCIPYRDEGKVTVEGQAAFTTWFFKLIGHKFIGADNRGFLSPQIFSSGSKRGVDPIYDISKFAKDEPSGKWKHLVTRDGQQPPLIRPPRKYAVSNALVRNVKTGVDEVRLLIYPRDALTRLLSDLNRLTPPGSEQVVSEKWPDYLLGDITDPLDGLKFEVVEGYLHQGGFPIAVFEFSKLPGKLVGHEKAPFDPASEEGLRILSARYDLGNVESVMKVADPQEMVEHLVSSTDIPYPLIQAACEGTWHVPSERTRVQRTTFPATNINPPQPGAAK